jgi:hypothetical protein
LQAKPHWPVVHVAVLWAGGAHGSHEPQWLGSVCWSTQLEPQRSGVGSEQLLVHEYDGPSGEQSGVGSEQAVVQPPQCSAVVRSVSHPGSVVQSPHPGRQASVSTHSPAEQVTFAGSTPGSAVQSLLQEPQ